MKTLFFTVIWAALFGGVLSSCNKFLDERPLKSMVVPNTPDDLQALLDVHNNMVIASPDLPEVLADNYYVTFAHWNAANETNRMNYIWDAQAVSEETWRYIYQGPVYYTNVVLDQLALMEPRRGEQPRHDEIRGTALFYRAFYFQQLAQLYCKPYSPSAGTDPGIPLRLTAAIEEPSVRSTVKQTYERIIHDMQAALELLPAQTLFPTRPAKAAVYGALARTCLSMGDYEQAGTYADHCIALHPHLMDYNLLPATDRPFPRFNEETIFYNNTTTVFSLLGSSRAKIDTILYRSYDDSDLRKQLFFRKNTGANAGTYCFQGNYDGDLGPTRPFTGITTGEMYLIRAECHARAGRTEAALKDLNTLLVKRWRNDGSWTPVTAPDAAAALEYVLDERRKELVFRGLRWSDLRRLNQEGRNITLRRELNGQVYTLPPGDPRWVQLIPHEIINRSGMEQNERD